MAVHMRTTSVAFLVFFMLPALRGSKGAGGRVR
jgi:hypothetical protein